MSHTTLIKSIAIKSITALLRAIEELQANGVKCSVKRNVKPRMYYADQHKACDYVLHLENCQYDIGFEFDAETQAYIPVFDEYRNYVRDYIGNKDDTKEGCIGKLLEAYSKAAVIETAEEQGYQVTSVSKAENGDWNVCVVCQY